MKTIPVSLLLAGMILPAAHAAKPADSQRGEKPGRPFQEAWQRADTNKDGVISRAEFDAMPRISKLPEEKRTEIFARLDKDKDGSLSRDELGKFGRSRDGDPMKRLWELDADKSGGISFEEFKSGQLFKKLPADKQEKIFKRLDTDGDGFITPKDRPEPPPFKHRKGQHKKRPGAPPAPGGMDMKLDSDGDGALSFAEFRKSPAVRDLTEDEQEDRFEKLDRNGDHKLTPDEIHPLPKREAPPPADG